MWIQTVEQYFLWLMFYSIVGWIYESLLCSASAHRWINRGFLNGPYCPIYGFGAVLDILLLGRIQNPLLLFCLGAVVTCSLEYLTSYLMELLFHARWWDYSERKFNINGRVCLIGAVVFGAFSVVLILGIHPFVVHYTDLLPPLALHLSAVMLLMLIAADAGITIGGFSGFNKRLEELSVILEQAGEEMADKLRTTHAYNALNAAYDSFEKKMNLQQRRMLAAFPRLKSTSHNHMLAELKNRLASRRNTARK